MRRPNERRALLGVLGFTFLTAACTQDMGFQKRQSVTRLRLAPEGTLAVDGPSAAPRPARITRALLERGQSRFEIHCTPCHGLVGYGDGMVVKRGFLPPPSYHIERLRHTSDRELFNAITNGENAMPSYAFHLDEGDRWAVVAYIRALQLSQHPAGPAGPAGKEEAHP